MNVPYSGLTRNASGTPLVSRSAELEQLDAVIDRLHRGDAPVIVDITGEAGIGKSRLMGEFRRRAREQGVTVLYGQATEYERHTPFQPFTDAFADLDPLALSPVSELAEAASPVLGRPASSPAQLHADRFGLYRTTAALLAHLGREGLVVALDDLHWADPSSLELLDYLIRHPVRAPVLLVIARRDRQTATSLAAALTRGVDTGAVLRLELGPLAERECVERLAPDLPRGHAAELYAASEGNPLYFLALLHAHRDGAPVRRGSALPYGPATGSSSGGLPTRLGSLPLDELTPLTPSQRRIVEDIAVLGDHATPALLGQIGEHGETELDGDILTLIRRDLVRTCSGGRLTLRHPVIRALVYESIAPQRRIGIHRRAAAELARAGASAGERAHHIEQSLTGWDPDAIAVLIEAAEQVKPTAPATCAHWLEAVLRLLPDTCEHAARRGELTLLRARALGASGALRESRDLLHEVISASGPDDASVRTDAIALCAVMERHLGRPREATALLRRELSRRPPPSPRHAVSLGLELGLSALSTACYPDAREEVAHTLSTARSLGDEIGETSALALAAMGEAYEGEIAAARAFAGRAAAMADALTDNDLFTLCESLARLGWTEVFLEAYADAERHADRGVKIARRSGQIHLIPYLLICKAYAHLQTCRVPSALELAEEAEPIARAVGSGELLAFTLGIKSLILLYAHLPGDPRALAAGEEAVALVGTSDSWWASLAWVALAYSAMAAGDPQRAREAMLRAGGGSELRRLQPSARPGYLDLLVSTAIATGDLENAERWAARAREEAGRLDLPTQRAAVLRGTAALAAHRGDTGAAARMMAEAAQEYARSGSSLREAHALLLAARLTKAAGDPSRAAAMWRRAHRLASFGGARLLTGLAERARPVVVEDEFEPLNELATLTAREWEIARLVAEGLTSQAIAIKLYLSPRTVETHLSRIYRKTGVSSRAGLATLVARHGADQPVHGTRP
ncbi:helix-turn-helix transcriptional regulator [Streptosporangium sp. NPDC000396]|uniref:helix-turn-helix transcriptional regulator n=1 Tax=Streptosporangium sp. NPDC000396 TaxID=3366185 RepID=UPI0036B99465